MCQRTWIQFIIQLCEIVIKRNLTGGTEFNFINGFGVSSYCIRSFGVWGNFEEEHKEDGSVLYFLLSGDFVPICCSNSPTAGWRPTARSSPPPSFIVIAPALKADQQPNLNPGWTGEAWESASSCSRVPDYWRCWMSQILRIHPCKKMAKSCNIYGGKN